MGAGKETREATNRDGYSGHKPVGPASASARGAAGPETRRCACLSEVKDYINPDREGT